MKIKNLLLAALMLNAYSLNAQDVDKATVEGNASAAQTAVADLKKVDTGEKAWKFDGVVGLNGAATGLVNWSAGGKNNVNGVAFAKLHLLYHKDAIAWESNLDTDYGITWIQQDEDPFQKSSDNLKFSTKFGWEFHKNFYLTVLGSFQSQYAIGRDYVSGYNPMISKWLAPSYTDISVGIDWKKSVNGADFSIYLSPIAGRITTAYISNKWNEKYSKEAYMAPYKEALEAEGLTDIEKTLAQALYETENQIWDATYQMLKANGQDVRTDLQTRYATYKYENGDKKFRNFRAEFGLSLKAGVAYKYKELTLSTTLGLFTPYAWDKTELASYENAATRKSNFETVDGYSVADHYFKYQDMNRRFGNFDVDWDVAISYQFLKVLNVTLSTSLKYYNGTLVANKDGLLAERVQFKSVLGVGIGYSF